MTTVTIVDESHTVAVSDAPTTVEVSTGGGSGAAEIAAHLADAGGAHAASAISYVGGTGMSATDIEAAIDELATEKQNAATVAADSGVTAHLADTADAHDASAISFSPTGTIAATDVQAALAEVASEGGGGGGTSAPTEYTLASSSSVGATTITLDRAPVGIGAGVGWIVIDPYTTECEIRQVTGVAGAVVTLKNCLTLSVSTISFQSGPKTITFAVGNVSSSRKMFPAGNSHTKIIVTGSASNNGTFTPTAISADGTVLTVAETIVTESAGAAVSIRVDMNFTHASGDRVMVLAEDRVPFAWYGVKGQVGTTDAAGYATDNVKGWNRLVNDSVWQNFTHAIIPADTVYVNNECYLEDGKHYWGPNQILSQIKATTTFPTFTTEIAVLHGRDNGQAVTYDGAGACRASLHEIKVNGGNTSSGTGSTEDGTPAVPGSNGILMSCQQPVLWEGVRIDTCDGYGVSLGEMQQIDIGRLQVVRCRVGVLLRNVSFFFCHMLNIEECSEVGFRTELPAGSAGSAYNATILLDHVHTEHHGVVPTVADFDLTRASTIRVTGAHHSASVGSTTYLFNSGKSDSIAPIYDIYAEWTGNPASCIAVEDVIRGHSLNAAAALGTTMAATRIMSGTPDAPSAGSPLAFHAINILGSAGSYKRIGLPAGSSTYKPALDTAQLPSASGNRFFAGYNSSGVLAVTLDDTSLGLGTAGAIIKAGTGTPESVVTAPVGSLFLRTNGGAGTTLYVKESGAGNTGWIAK